MLNDAQATETGSSFPVGLYCVQPNLPGLAEQRKASRSAGRNLQQWHGNGTGQYLQDHVTRQA
jgi:hypothetical protein